MSVAVSGNGFLDRLNERTAAWSTRAKLAAGYALAIGGLSVAINAADAIDGSVPALGRAALGLFGFVAGVLLWARRDLEAIGWRLALLWALLQIPVFAWDVDGSVTTQVIRFPLMASSESTVNGRVTSASEVGVNLLAIGLAAVYAKLQTKAIARRR